MPNFYGAPEITVSQLAEKLRNGDDVRVLDIREMDEIARVALDSPKLHIAPLSELAVHRLGRLPEEVRERSAEVVVMCHHGIRSAQVTMWLLAEGWENVTSLAGGIDAYAREIDPEIGFY